MGMSLVLQSQTKDLDKLSWWWSSMKSQEIIYCTSYSGEHERPNQMSRQSIQYMLRHFTRNQKYNLKRKSQEVTGVIRIHPPILCSECLCKVSWQCHQELLRYVSRDQSGELTGQTIMPCQLDWKLQPQMWKCKTANSYNLVKNIVDILTFAKFCAGLNAAMDKTDLVSKLKNKMWNLNIKFFISITSKALALLLLSLRWIKVDVSLSRGQVRPTFLSHNLSEAKRNTPRVCLH